MPSLTMNLLLSIQSPCHIGIGSSQVNMNLQIIAIFQEEFEASEEIGKLSCGHGYHVHCIKQWLSRKNACPLCKTAVSKP